MKRVIAICLAVLLTLSVMVTGAMSVSAKTVDAAQTGDNQVIYFDYPSTKWDSSDKVYCHIWEEDKEALSSWQSSSELCAGPDNNGVYTYDITANGFVILPDRMYCCMFSTANDQTLTVKFDTTVLGDKVICSPDDNMVIGEETYTYASWEVHTDTRYRMYTPAEIRWKKLLELRDIAVHTYGCGIQTYSEADMYEWHTVPGEYIILDYTNETNSELRAVLTNLYLLNLAYLGGTDIKTDVLDEYIDNMEAALDAMVLEKRELAYLLNLSAKDISDTGYYDSQLFEEFLSAYNAAKEVNDDESITDKRVNGVFWALLEKYNDICLQNSLAGDVDGDGVVSIVDATVMQKYLAKVIEFNSSQLLVATIGGTQESRMKDRINVLGVTNIQLYLADLGDAPQTEENKPLPNNSRGELDRCAMYNVNRFYQWAA